MDINDILKKAEFVVKHPTAKPSLIGFAVGTIVGGVAVERYINWRASRMVEQLMAASEVFMEHVSDEGYEEALELAGHGSDWDDETLTTMLKDAIDELPERHNITPNLTVVHDPNKDDEDDVVRIFPGQNMVEEEEEPEEEPEVQTIFERGPHGVWDETAERHNRSSDRPYQIHEDEYTEWESRSLGFSHQQLTYFDGDDTLVDENNVPVNNHEKVVGTLRFGHGTNDPSVCFVRNSELKAEYEILLVRGTFAEELYGVDAETGFEEQDLRHGDIPPKFRLKD